MTRRHWRLRNAVSGRRQSPGGHGRLGERATYSSRIADDTIHCSRLSSHLIKDRLAADNLYRSVEYAIQRFAIAGELEQRNREREQARLALAESEERYRTLVQATSATVWTRSPAGEFVEPQPSWEAYTGQAWEQHKGWGWLEANHPEDRERARAAWRHALDTRSVYELEGAPLARRLAPVPLFRGSCGAAVRARRPDPGVHRNHRGCGRPEAA
ncbi:MAG: PAS domain-containing protein [Acidobacteria bacterium]|nr:PAS domain-containing protein [Acidobacteriota bacterium]